MALPFLVIGNFLRSLRSSNSPGQSSPSRASTSSDAGRRPRSRQDSSSANQSGAPRPAMTVPAVRPDMSQLRRRTRGEEEANVGLDQHSSSSAQRSHSARSSTSSGSRRSGRQKQSRTDNKAEKEPARTSSVQRQSSRSSSSLAASGSSSASPRNDKPTFVHLISTILSRRARASRAWQRRHDHPESKVNRPWQAAISWLTAKDDQANDSKRDAEIEPKYRWAPNIAAIGAPFAILLQIPGLTEHWYIQDLSVDLNTISNAFDLVYQDNPILLEVGLAFSMAAAVVGNVALIARFLDRRVRRWTVIALVALPAHALINATAMLVFGVRHPINAGGYIYAEAYWMTLAATICSTISVSCLVLDWCRTDQFHMSGSGLTTHQRKLVLTLMTLLSYIALGALAYSLMLSISFQNALYFTVISIETIGFGDIRPTTVASKIFCFFYQTFGIILFAFTIDLAQKTLLESWQAAYRRRRVPLRLRKRQEQSSNADGANKQHVVEERLKAMNVDVWVPVGEKREDGKRRLMTLNLKALEGEGDEVGEELREEVKRLKGVTPEDMRKDKARREEEHKRQEEEDEEDDKHLQEKLEKEEAREFWFKLAFAGGLFVAFWMVGAAVFMQMESWSFFLSMYFCYIAFSTIGFGGTAPVTPFGRAFFIIWSMFGVATMTILFSVLGDAYSSQYGKGSLETNAEKTTHKMQARRMALLKKKAGNNKKAKAARERAGSDADEKTPGRRPSDASTGSSSSSTSSAHPDKKKGAPAIAQEHAHQAHSDSHPPQTDQPSNDEEREKDDDLDDPDAAPDADKITRQLIDAARTFHTQAHYLLTHAEHPFDALPLPLQHTLAARADKEVCGDETAKEELLDDVGGRRELLIGGFDECFRALMKKASEAMPGEFGSILEDVLVEDDELDEDVEEQEERREDGEEEDWEGEEEEREEEWKERNDREEEGRKGKEGDGEGGEEGREEKREKEG